MDWNYLHSIVAFVIGGLAGFQGVYERYNKDALKASTTPPGFFYLFTRPALPAGVFAGLYASDLVKSNLLVAALACGTGTEVFLRTKVFIKQEQKAGGVDELLKGPLDLLRWYQNLFLEAAASSIAKSKKEFVRKHLPESVGFPGLYDIAVRNMDAWPQQQFMATLKTEIDKLETEFDARQADPLGLFSETASDAKQARGSGNDLDQQYRFKLGFLIYNHVGRKGFKTLLSS